jgi:hypothetical protein
MPGYHAQDATTDLHESARNSAGTGFLMSRHLRVASPVHEHSYDFRHPDILLSINIYDRWLSTLSIG